MRNSSTSIEIFSDLLLVFINSSATNLQFNQDAVLQFLNSEFEAQLSTSHQQGSTRQSVEEKTREQADQTPSEIKYTHKTSQVKLTQENMLSILRILNEYHYNGRLHHDTDSESITCLGGWSPKHLGYQLVNTIEVTSFLTAAWQLDKSFEPGVAVFSSLAVIAGFVIRNNYLYAGLTDSSFTPDAREEKNAEIQNCSRELGRKLSIIEESSSESLTKSLTKPRCSQIVMTEVGCLASVLTKVAASVAVVSAVMNPEGLPMIAASIAAGVLMGSIEAIDTAFTKISVIGGENRRLIDFLQGVIPTLEPTDFTPYFKKVADFSILPWTMAKIGPLAWAAVKTMSADKVFQLSGATLPQLATTRESVRLLVLVSSLMFSNVFTDYNVKKLEEELPTKRDFSLTSQKGIARLGASFLSALSAAGLTSGTAHITGTNMMTSAGVGGATLITLLPMLYQSDRVAHFVDDALTMKWPSRVFAKVDAGKPIEKITATGLTAGIASAGFVYGNSYIAAPAVMMTYFLLTSLIAEVSRPMANMARFTPVQTSLYAAAFLEWIVKTATPLTAMAKGQSVEDCPDFVDSNYFTSIGSTSIIGLAVLISFLAGVADWEATGAQVNKINEPVPNTGWCGAIASFFRSSPDERTLNQPLDPNPEGQLESNV